LETRKSRTLRHNYKRAARERRKGWDVMESQATEITYHPHLLPAEVLAV
jgi:hypothetical protein